MNPELQRNLWLEASPRRTAWAGVAVLGVYAAVYLSSDGGGPALLRALGGAGAFIFFAAALVWGVRLAGQSVASEIGERTWDFQRLSALDPWAMTWGKLFGGTALAVRAIHPGPLRWETVGDLLLDPLVYAVVLMGVLGVLAGYVATTAGTELATLADVSATDVMDVPDRGPDTVRLPARAGIEFGLRAGGAHAQQHVVE